MICRLMAITWTNVDFSLVSFCGIHMKAIAQCMPKLLNEFENDIFEIDLATSPRGQWVKRLSNLYAEN